MTDYLSAFKSLSRPEAAWLGRVLRQAESKLGVSIGSPVAAQNLRAQFVPGVSVAPSGVRIVANVGGALQVLWNASSLVSDANDPVVYYEVQVADNNLFVNPQTFPRVQPFFDFVDTVGDISATKRHYVRVRGVRRSGSVTAWSPIIDTARARAVSSNLDFNVATSITWERLDSLSGAFITQTTAPAGTYTNDTYYGGLNYTSLGRTLVPLVWFQGEGHWGNDHTTDLLDAYWTMQLREDGVLMGDKYEHEMWLPQNSVVTPLQIIRGRFGLATMPFTSVAGNHVYDVLVHQELYIHASGNSGFMEFIPDHMVMILFEVL